MIAPLRCPSCKGQLDLAPNARCQVCQRAFNSSRGYIDLLEEPLAGFTWAYQDDPRISPATLARWRALVRINDALLRAEAGTSARVVNIGGAGEDWFGRASADLLAEYLVVDPSALQLEITRPPDGVETLLVRAAGEDLPIESSWADAVWLHGVLDHVADPRVVVQEAARVVRPGGAVVLSLTNDASWYRRLASVIGLSTRDAHVHQHHLSARDLSQLVRMCGLNTVDARSTGYLRLPSQWERSLLRGARPGLIDALLRSTDAIGRAVFGKAAGGISVVVGVRPLHK